ncbi:MAG: hypothetical protein ACO1TE_30015 [Prosthecobacter sp.]
MDWLNEWADQLRDSAEMTLIGSAALLWHVARIGRDDPLPENSMDADPVTESDAVAELAYDSLIGSEFEQRHGWHVNLMPRTVLHHLPADWQTRAFSQTYGGKLRVVVPAVADLLVPKRMRNEARDRAHEAFVAGLGLI